MVSLFDSSNFNGETMIRRWLSGQFETFGLASSLVLGSSRLTAIVATAERTKAGTSVGSFKLEFPSC